MDPIFDMFEVFTGISKKCNHQNHSLLLDYFVAYINNDFRIAPCLNNIMKMNKLMDEHVDLIKKYFDYSSVDISASYYKIDIILTYFSFPEGNFLFELITEIMSVFKARIEVTYAFLNKNKLANDKMSKDLVSLDLYTFKLLCISKTADDISNVINFITKRLDFMQ